MRLVFQNEHNANKQKAQRMKILWAKEISVPKDRAQGDGKLFAVLVEVTDIAKIATDMHDRITETSWLNDLDVIDQTTFRATSAKTIEKLVECIANRQSNPLSEDFGEYLITDVALEALHSQYQHTKVPLAELLKEKISGNPGFDFHTETPANMIAYGESKYSGSSTRYSDALRQISEFIRDKKDDIDLRLLNSFVSSVAISNHIAGKKSYSAAFSINAKNPELIMDNVAASDSVMNLLACENLFLIGVVVNAY